MNSPSPSRAWQRMLSGRRLDLLDPRPEDIAIEDIAHGLARVARWNGQTSGPHIFSVAQHCLLVEAIRAAEVPPASSAALLAALLHDAAEYVVGDLISPFKAALGRDYKAVEDRVLRAVHLRFDVAAAAVAEAQRIKVADRAAARLEAVLLAGFAEAEANLFFGPSLARADRFTPMLEPLPSDEVAARFHDRYITLATAMDAGG